MKSLHINLGERSYDIEIERGSLDFVGEKLAKIAKPCRAIVLTDSNVGPIYARRVEKSLASSGFAPTTVTFPAGEESKNISCLAGIYSQMARAGITRSDMLIALGGGVAGDMGGFAAATFLRGIDFVQIPTSLLAQVDSSVGGKTAIDLPEGKNLVGAFYQPKAVFIDPDMLASLPAKNVHDGLAEVIKYGCIFDEKLFELIESCRDDEDLLKNSEKIIYTCCDLKRDVVEKDEFDNGVRMLLNFGHTFGHAVEKTFNYEKYTHGEGVAIGMCFVTAKSEASGITRPGTVKRLAGLLEKFGLPTTAEMTADDYFCAVSLDKKKRGSEISLILIEKIGKAFVKKYRFDDLKTEYGD